MKHLARLLTVMIVLSILLSVASCATMDAAGGRGDLNFSGGGYKDESMAPGSSIDGLPEMDDTGVEDGENAKDEIIYLPSGMITAGAWSDNTYYSNWLDLFKQGDENAKFYKYYSQANPYSTWGFNSLNRVKLSVKFGDDAVAGANVVATDADGNVVYKAVTNAEGIAYIFTSAETGSVTVTSGEGSATSEFTSDSRSLEVNLDSKAEKLNVIELMFVVDVTGSMGDEIGFLKAELSDVINKIAANDLNTKINLALLFYRDTEDKVPFDYYDFTDVTTEIGLAAQQEAINKQNADGGGDYPEAVDEALNIAVNKQWSSGATTKIIFHVLDAPAHNKMENKEKLVNATKTAAEKGIRICPIICSGAAEETEYTMREAAIYTDGTFIFVTDDSGIGGSHHDPGLPNATIELLNSMLVRLTKGYHTGVFETPIYWKDDPNLATNKSK